jgi:hypothetical protein
MRQRGYIAIPNAITLYAFTVSSKAITLDAFRILRGYPETELANA